MFYSKSKEQNVSTDEQLTEHSHTNAQNHSVNLPATQRHYYQCNVIETHTDIQLQSVLHSLHKHLIVIVIDRVRVKEWCLAAMQRRCHALVLEYNQLVPDALPTDVLRRHTCQQ